MHTWLIVLLFVPAIGYAIDAVCPFHFKLERRG